MAATRFTLESADGTPVVVHRWEPDGEVRGVVNVVHGLVEHAGRYAELAAALNGIGLAVYAEDHRGHGETARTEDELGFFAEDRGWVRVLNDVHRVTLRARADHPDVPVYLLGHSLGAVLGLQHAYTFPDETDGLVLTAPIVPTGLFAFVGELLVRFERRRLGKRGRSSLIDAYLFGQWNKPFQPTRTRHDFLSRDPDEVDRYIEDPLCGFIYTTQLGLDITLAAQVVGRLDWTEAELQRDTPVRILAGSEDPAGGRMGAEHVAATFASAGFTDVEHLVYDGGRHEVLHEINRDEVIAELLAWFERRIDRQTTA